MEIIVAVDKDWGIGRGDRLLFRIREDLQRFRDMTIGKTVILGRKTQQTFPGGKPLKNRTNVIMTRNPGFAIDEGDCIICHSMADLFHYLKVHGTDGVFVIGGESVYRQLLPYCHLAHVTEVDAKAGADCYFPNLGQSPGWVLEHEEKHRTDQAGVIDLRDPVALGFSYCTYRQTQVRCLDDMEHEQ